MKTNPIGTYNGQKAACVTTGGMGFSGSRWGSLAPLSARGPLGIRIASCETLPTHVYTPVLVVHEMISAGFQKKYRYKVRGGAFIARPYVTFCIVSTTEV